MSEIKQPKRRDTKELGHTIPIENIGAIAGTIASSGIYGGGAAVEALLTGGVSALLESGESMLGSAIGGGGAATGDSLLGGPVGHIVSGLQVL